MGKQWVRQEIHRNEVANAVGRAVLWARANPQTAAGSGGAAALVLAAALFYAYRTRAAAEESWERLAVAQSMAYQGQQDAALAKIKEIDENYPRSAASEYGAIFGGDILYRQGKYKEAAAAYQGLLDRQASPVAAPMAHSNLALAQEAAADCKAALETAQRFLDLYQDHYLAPQVHGCLARCLESLGDKDKAKSAIERISLLYPDTYWSRWAQERLKS